MNKQVFGLMLASTLSLSTMVGCAATTPTVAAQTNGTASSDSGAEMASASAEERNMDDYATVAQQEDASAKAYTALALLDGAASTAAAAGTATPATTATAGATAAATVTAPPSRANIDALLIKLRAGQVLAASELAEARRNIAASLTLTTELRAAVKARTTAREAAIRTRLDKLAEQRVKLRAALKAAAYVDLGDGTSSKTFEIDDSRTVNGKTVTRHCKLVKIAKTDTKELVSWHAEFNQALGGGISRVSTRDKTLLADGSYLVVFHSDLTFPNGRMRTADWTKVIAADGTITGKGTINWKDKAGSVVKTATLTLSGDEDKAALKCDETGATAAMVVDGQTMVKADDGKTASVDADSAAADTAGAGDSAATTSTGAGATTTTVSTSTSSSATATTTAK